MLSIDLDVADPAALGTFAGLLGQYRALRVKEGEPVSLGTVTVDGESVLYLHAGVAPEAANGSARLAVRARPVLPGADARTVVDVSFPGGGREAKALVELLGWRGEYEFFVEARGVSEVLILRGTQRQSDFARSEADFICLAEQVVPFPGEPAFAFAIRGLFRPLPYRGPDFAARLAARNETASRSGHTLRLLSVGTGNGVAETELLRCSHRAVELVLTGGQEVPLREAARRMFDHHVD